MEGDTLGHLRLIADVGHLDAIGSAGAHTLDGISTVQVGHRIVLGARGLMHSRDGGTNHALIVLVGDQTGHRGRGHLCVQSQCGTQRQHQRPKLHSLKHFVLLD